MLNLTSIISTPVQNFILGGTYDKQDGIQKTKLNGEKGHQKKFITHLWSRIPCNFAKLQENKIRTKLIEAIVKLFFNVSYTKPQEDLEPQPFS